MRRDCTDGHSNTEVYQDILYINVLSTGGQLVALMSRLHGYSIIVRSYGQVANSDIGSRRVDSICVQGIGWDAQVSTKVEERAELGMKFLLGEGIDIDLKVLEQEAIHIIEKKMI